MKKYTIIGVTTLLILITSFIAFKPKKISKPTIEPVDNNTNIKIQEEVKQEEQTKEICEEIAYPLLSKSKEDRFPTHDSTGPITEEKLKEIIDHQLSFLIYKNNYQEITNRDLFYQAIMDKNIYKNETFTKEELNNSLEKTVLSNLKLRHESHYSDTGYNYIYENGIYTTDDSNYQETDVYDEHPIYGEVQEFKEENEITKIKVKYLWIAGNNEPTTILYKNRYDARKKINKIQMPNNVKCYSKWIKDHFKRYEKDLPTYTYTFKEVNNHIYLVDFYITENN